MNIPEQVKGVFERIGRVFLRIYVALCVDSLNCDFSGLGGAAVKFALLNSRLSHGFTKFLRVCGGLSYSNDSKQNRSGSAYRSHTWRKILGPYRRCAGAVPPESSRIVSRRGICDRVIWKKPLALAADAVELWGLLGSLKTRGRDWAVGAGFRKWRCSINRGDWAKVG